MKTTIKKQSLRTRPNYLYAILSVAIVLFFIGLFGMVIIHARKFSTVLKERVNILIEIKEATPKAEIDQLITDFNSSFFVKEGSVDFVSKEEAVEVLREDFGEDFMKMDMTNPLYDVITLNLKADYMNEDSLDVLRTAVVMNQNINNVYYEESMVEAITSNITRLGFLFGVIGLCFVFVAIILIHNTIKLALYSNRFLIKNMELVGASWEFISTPYIKKGVTNGFISAILAIIALGVLLAFIRGDIPEFQSIVSLPDFFLLFAMIIVIGVLMSGTSTYYVVNKYLKMRLDDLY